MKFDLVLHGGHAVTPSGIIKTDIGVIGGKIVDIGDLAGADAAEKVDCTGLHVLPGVVDTQVHFREPGNEHKEDLATGTLSAIAGGVTGVFEMPNTNPLTTSIEQLNDKLDRAKGRAWCNYGFFVGGTADNAENLLELERAPGCCGVKIFMGSSTGNLLVTEDEAIERILKYGFRRVSVHAEDEARLLERKSVIDDSGKHSQHPHWRDDITAIKATNRILALAKKTGRRVHVLHITTKDEMDILAEHKDVCTVETTPQHLTLSAPDCYDRMGGYAQMNPPIRGEEHRLGLWEAVRKGIVDIIGSDHAPHTKEEKEKAYPESPSGMPGVQTLVPIMLNHVNQGNLTLERLVDLVCHGPNRVHGIACKGRLVVGYDADFTVVDMKAKRTITNDMMKSKCGWTPYDGMEVTGWPVMTVLLGKTVMRDDEIIGDPMGQPFEFLETLENKWPI